MYLKLITSLPQKCNRLSCRIYLHFDFVFEKYASASNTYNQLIKCGFQIPIPGSGERHRNVTILPYASLSLQGSSITSRVHKSPYTTAPTSFSSPLELPCPLKNVCGTLFHISPGLSPTFSFECVLKESWWMKGPLNLSDRLFKKPPSLFEPLGGKARARD